MLAGKPSSAPNHGGVIPGVTVTTIPQSGGVVRDTRPAAGTGRGLHPWCGPWRHPARFPSVSAHVCQQQLDATSTFMSTRATASPATPRQRAATSVRSASSISGLIDLTPCDRRAACSLSVTLRVIASFESTPLSVRAGHSWLRKVRSKASASSLLSRRLQRSPSHSAIDAVAELLLESLCFQGIGLRRLDWRELRIDVGERRYCLRDGVDGAKSRRAFASETRAASLTAIQRALASAPTVVLHPGCGADKPTAIASPVVRVLPGTDNSATK